MTQTSFIPNNIRMHLYIHTYVISYKLSPQQLVKSLIFLRIQATIDCFNKK